MRPMSRTTGGGDGRFAAGFLTAVLTVSVFLALGDVIQWMRATDWWAWLTATRTVEFTIIGVLGDLVVPVLVVGMIVASFIVALGCHRGGVSG